MSANTSSYRRLVVTRPNGVVESFDLRHYRTIRAGEEDSNDVALTSTLVPFEFKLLSRSWFGNKQQLHLTDEIIGTLKGNAVAQKTWKNRLYSGQIYDITGEAQWSIGDVHFKIEEVPTLALEGLRTQLSAEEKRDFRKAVGYTMAVYALLFLLITTVGFIRGLFIDSPVDVAVQKVSLEKAKEIFKKEIPVPVVEVQVPVEKVPEPIKEKPKKLEQNKSTQKAAKKASQNLKSAAGKTGGTKPRNVKNLGLLAIQTTPGASRVSIAVAAPKVVTQVTDASREPMLGLGRATSGIGVSEGNPQSIAQLGSISGKSYEGGLGAELQAARTPSIALVRKEVEVRGALDPAVIRQIIEERLSEIRYCYENALLKQTGLSGKIAASWTIQSDGSVAQVISDSSEIEQKLLHPCVRKQIAQWKFPSPKGGGVVKVKYPFLFNPVGGIN